MSGKADPETQDFLLWGKSLTTLGEWHAESRAKSARVIFDEYLLPAVEHLKIGRVVRQYADLFLIGICSGKADADDLLKALHCLAIFSDEQYQSIVDHLASADYEAASVIRS